MVDGVVRQSGGGIWVDSASGVGTTFRIRLPRVRGGTGTLRPVPPPGPASGGSEIILLVEDEPAVRAIARRILAGAGYVVLEAADPQSAGAVIATRGTDIDLLLTDVMMPGGIGPDVAHRLAAVNSRAVVLYMSGYTDDAIRHRDVLEPDVKLMTKPFSAEELLATVRGVLGPETERICESNPAPQSALIPPRRLSVRSADRPDTGS